MEIIDTNIIGAMSTNINVITNRLIWHFNILGCIEPDSKNFIRIYSSLIDVYFLNQTEKNLDISEQKTAYKLTVEASFDLY